MNWLVEFEKPSKEWSNGESGNCVPNKKHDDAVRSWLSLLPGNVGVEDECKDGRKDVRNTTREPK